MKKLHILFILVILTGCVKSSFVSSDIPAEMIKNEKCLASKLQIFQSLENGALAHLCYTEYNKFGYCNGEEYLVFLEVNKKDNDFVDKQKVILPDNKCFMSYGKYTYMAGIKDPHQKTIRKVKIADSHIKNPAYLDHIKHIETRKNKN